MNNHTSLRPSRVHGVKIICFAMLLCLVCIGVNVGKTHGGSREFATMVKLRADGNMLRNNEVRLLCTTISGKNIKVR
jgi:hypothetical protein